MLSAPIYGKSALRVTQYAFEIWILILSILNTISTRFLSEFGCKGAGRPEDGATIEPLHGDVIARSLWRAREKNGQRVNEILTPALLFGLA